MFSRLLSTDSKLLIYQALIHLHLMYLPGIYAYENYRALREFRRAQNTVVKIFMNLPIRYSSKELYRS